MINVHEKHKVYNACAQVRISLTAMYHLHVRCFHRGHTCSECIQHRLLDFDGHHFPHGRRISNAR